MGIINDMKVANKKNIDWVWIIFIAIILLISIIRLRLIQAPLERDEGEYAYAGQLILQGIPPYLKLYNMKMPGIYAVYAAILAVFGQTQSGIHFGLLLANITSIILLFFIGKKLFNPAIGLITGVSFAALSISQSIQGIFANAEHFVLTPALGGILLLLCAISSNRIKYFFWSGIFLGLGFVIKQHGAFFIIFAFVYLLYNIRKIKPSNFIIFFMGIAAPFMATCLMLLWAGVFKNFWFWVFDYSREYISSMPLKIGLTVLNSQAKAMWNESFLLLYFACLGFTALAWNKNVRQNIFFIFSFCLFSFLSICPGFYFRSHYFILLLPAIALLTGIGINSFCGLFQGINSLTIKRGIIFLSFSVPLILPLYIQHVFLFKSSPERASRMTYGLNPFPESIEIAKYIKENSSENDTIAVIGSEPQIYFYSQRHSATGFIYTYPLMEKQKYALKMQEQMIAEIESKQPKFLIFVNIPTSWLMRPDSEKLIFKWFAEYTTKYYKPAGIVDIIFPAPSIYLWGDKSINYAPRSNCWIGIYERKG